MHEKLKRCRWGLETDGVHPLFGIVLAAFFLTQSMFGAPTITIGTAQVPPGGQGEISVQLQEGSVIRYLQFDILFNGTYFSPEVGSLGSSFSGSLKLDWRIVEPGRLRVVIHPISVCSSLQEVPIEELLFKLGVPVPLSTPPGLYPFSTGPVTAADALGNPISTATQAGRLSVWGSPVEPIPTLTDFGLMLLMLALMWVGLRLLRRRGRELTTWLGIVLILLTLIPQGMQPLWAQNLTQSIVDAILGRRAATGEMDCNRDQAVNVLDLICAQGPCTSNSPPDLLPVGNRSFPLGTPLDFRLFAVDRDPGDRVTFSLVNGPSGLSVASDSGRVQWSPISTGTFPVRARVADLAGLFDEEDFQIEIFRDLTPTGNQNRPPVLEKPADQVRILGQSLDLQVKANDPDADAVLTYSLPAAPSGMTIGSSGGGIHWTPQANQIGVHDVTVMVKDQHGAADAASFMVTVKPVNRPPVAEDDAYRVGLGGTLDVAAPGVMENDSDPDGDGLTAIKVTEPTNGNLTLNADGSFEYTPTVPTYTGVYTVHEVTDTNLTLAYPMPKLAISTPEWDTGAYRAVNGIDNNLNTSWFAWWRGPEFFYDQSFKYAVSVKEVRIYSARDVQSQDFIAGVVQLFDADDNELYNTGRIAFPDVALPPDQRDVTIDIAGLAGAPVAGVRRVSFSSTEFEGNTNFPGFAELHVIGDGTVHESNVVAERVFVGPDYQRGTINAVFNVADLNGDGVADVVSPTNTAGIGNVRWTAYNGADGTALWQIPVFPYNTGLADPPQLYIATGENTLADIDGDGQPEFLVAAAAANQTTLDLLVAFNPDGSLKWISEPIDPALGGGIRSSAAAVADLDGDGDMEIVVSNYRKYVTIFDHNGQAVTHATGASPSGSGTGPDQQAVVADIDLDGRPEILSGDNAFAYDGTPLWTAGLSDFGGPLQASAVNLDDDPQAEVVLASSSGAVAAVEHDGSFKWLVPGAISGYARFAVADIDGDGHPNIVTTQHTAICSYDHNGLQLWCSPHQLTTTQDTFAGKTAPTAFDFDGDGIMEVVFRNQYNLMVYDGEDGTLLLAVPTRTYGIDLHNETTPLVVDQDGDGQAELMIPVSEENILIPPRHVEVWGAASGTWPATRPIWNTPAYHITNVKADGTVPSPAPVNWLTPGLNNTRVNVPLPEERTDRKDSFTYKANDGVLDSNTATVFLEIGPKNRPPVILSDPQLVVGAGFSYRYPVLSFDPDVGDVLTTSLEKGPAGMTIDGAGIVRWNPQTADLGMHSVVVSVHDQQGAYDIQNYELEVVIPQSVPDVVGQTQAAAETAITGAGFAVGMIRHERHPLIPAGSVAAQTPVGGSSVEPGTAVNLVLSLGPAPEDVDDDGDGIKENGGDCNDADPLIFPGAPDPEGDGVDQNCDGGDGIKILAEILVEPVDSTMLVGNTIPMKATGIFDDGTSAPFTDLVTWESLMPATVSVNSGGSAAGLAQGTGTIRASRNGTSGTASVNVFAVVSGDDAAPRAEIKAPAANATITAPIDIIGTATDTNFLKYRIELAVVGETHFTLIKESTTPVTSGVLGQFDPTLLLNDLYTVRLTVFDKGGNQTIGERVYQVDENMKVGIFTLTFNDLTIPMSGIPITVNRVYDSRDKGLGDFGIGWRLDIQTLRLNTNRPLATGWRMVKSSFFHQLVPTDQHKVSITLPDGRVEEFDMVLSRTTALGPGFDAFVTFQPRPGTTGSLALDEDSLVNVIGTGVHGEEIEIQNAGLTGLFNPQRFVYTLLDGTRVILTRAAGVESITDPNGNRITIGPGGITHSAGKSVVFDRDGQDRITKITDPAGNPQMYAYDVNGDLVGHSDRESNLTRFLYNLRHDLIRIDDPLGNQAIRNEYDADGRLIATINKDGDRFEYVHDLNGRTEALRNPNGTQKVYIYDGAGNVLKETDELGNTTTYTYDGEGNLTSQTNPLGATSTYTYDVNGSWLTQTDPLGNSFSYVRNSFGKLDIITGPLGETTGYTFDSRGNLLTEVDPLGNRREFTYDSAGHVIAERDQNGNLTQFDYDGFGNLTKRVGPGGTAVNYTYDALGNRLTESTSVTTPGGPQIVTLALNRDANGRVTRVTDPLGNSSNATYDPFGNPSSVEDAMGRSTQTTYSPAGKLEGLTFPDGLNNSVDYDFGNRPLTAINRAGQETQYLYDASGKPQALILPDNTPGNPADNRRVSFEYDAADRPTAIQYPGGRRAEFSYDLAGRRTGMTNPACCGTAQTTYDGAGRPLTTTDALGRVTQSVYDAAGRLIETVLPNGTTLKTAYDAKGNVSAMIDGAGNTTRYEYDSRSLLVAVIDPLGGRTEYRYDELGRRISQEDANGNVTRFEYDQAGRQSAAIRPQGQRVGFNYDAVGNLIGLTNARGQTINYEYNGVNKLTAKRFPDGTSVELDYEPSGARSTVTDSRGTAQFVYDVNNRLISRTEPDGASISYSYNEEGQVATITTPSGTVSYSYDGGGRLETVTDRDGGITTYSYDLVGNLTSTARPGGLTENRTYDSLNRISRLEHRDGSSNLLSAYEYSYDAAGNLISVLENAGRRVDYVYDPARRLRSETITAPGGAVRSIEYTYDSVGNRLTRNDSLLGLTTYTYDSNDQLLMETTNGLTVTYSYDADGNAVSRTGQQTAVYGWDAENKLISASVGGSDLSYVYNEEGIRVSREINGQPQSYLIDSMRQFAQVVEEYGPAGPSRSYLYGVDLLSQKTSEGRSVFLSDAHSGVRQLANPAGTATDSYVYDAFGRLAARTGATENHYLYRQEQFDPSLGSYYLRARYYDQNIGRFMSTDPYAGDPIIPMSLHRYLYANASPIMYSDPSGQVSLVEIIVVTAIVGTLLGAASTVGANLSYAIRGDRYGVAWTGTLTGGSVAIPGLSIGVFGAEAGLMNYSARSNCVRYRQSYRETKGYSASWWIGLFGIGVGLPVGATHSGVGMLSPGLIGPTEEALSGGALFLNGGGTLAGILVWGMGGFERGLLGAVQAAGLSGTELVVAGAVASPTLIGVGATALLLGSGRGGSYGWIFGYDFAVDVMGGFSMSWFPEDYLRDCNPEAGYQPR